MCGISNPEDTHTLIAHSSLQLRADPGVPHFTPRPETRQMMADHGHRAGVQMTASL